MEVVPVWLNATKQQAFLLVTTGRKSGNKLQKESNE